MDRRDTTDGTPGAAGRSRAARVACAAAALGLALGVVAGEAAGQELGPRLRLQLAGASVVERLPVIVVLEDGGGPATRSRIAATRIAALRGTAARRQPPLAALTDAPDRGLWLVNSLATRATPAEIAELRRAPGVAVIESDVPIRAAQSGSPGTPAATTWGLARMRVVEAWSSHGTRGAGTVIGSLDTGVDASHPALKARVARWRDFVAARATPYDDNGHGTHTIGTMVADGSSGTAVGVAPDAEVVVAKIMDAQGDGTASAALEAAQWIVDPDGDPATDDRPDVVNNSWGSASGGDVWFRRMVREWTALDIVPVFAAGNTGPGPATVVSPADYPESIAVGAIAEDGRIASFSARGPVTWSDPDGTGPPAGTRLAKPDIVAPGAGIVSTVPGGGYGRSSGTSMAAPHVAALAALVRQRRPDLGVAGVAAALRAGAVDAGAAGADDDFGGGVVDAPRTLAAAGILAAPASPPSLPVPPAAPAPPAPPPAPLPSPGPPAPPPSPVSAADVGRSRAIVVVAARRLNAFERRLPPGLRAGPIRAPRPRGPVSVSELRLTRTIAARVIRRAAVLQRRIGSPPYPRLRPLPRGPLRLDRAGVREVDRLARTALRVVRGLVRTRR